MGRAGGRVGSGLSAIKRMKRFVSAAYNTAYILYYIYILRIYYYIIYYINNMLMLIT